MPDILAIVSKAIFEQDALVRGELIAPGDVWSVDRYNSSAKGLTPLAGGGRIILVTVRPPDERLWVVGVIDAPLFDGSAWVGRAPNGRPVTDISALRGSIRFASGRGLPEERGTLGMSLQSPRALTDASAAEILAVVGGARPVAPSIVATAVAPVEEPPEPRAVRQVREAALDREVERFVVLFDRMEETYGLRLPQHLAYGVGFLAGLTADERAEGGFGTLIGVGAWFTGTELPRPPGGDERLRDRVIDDPPELVPLLAIANGETEERWGLWYDDSNELPTGIARRHGPTGAKETQLLGTTFLGVLRWRLSMATTLRGPTIGRWLDDVARAEAANVREQIVAASDRLVPGDMIGTHARQRRLATYAERAPVVEEWIELARAELRDGLPGRALLLGRELHETQAAPYRLACTELLIRAYHALGCRALADVVRSVYRHQGPGLPLYELPPPHPVIAAAANGDADAIAHALAEGAPPAPDEIEEALATAGNLPALDALLDHDSSHMDSALVRRLRMVFRSGKPKDAAKHRALALRLMERGNLNARAFERVLRAGDEELIRTVAARVDLTSDHEGSTPLHLAAKAGAASIVRALLARGADPRATNAAGRMAYDAAREAQIESPNDPAISEIMAMLQLAGGGIAKPPLPTSGEVDYEEGDAVHHGKLGDGIVESVTGEGPEAKLKIRFESETRTLLAKFVTRGEPS